MKRPIPNADWSTLIEDEEKRDREGVMGGGARYWLSSLLSPDDRFVVILLSNQQRISERPHVTKSTYFCVGLKLYKEK